METRHRLSVFLLLVGVGHVFCELVTVKTGADHIFKPKVTGEIQTILWKYQNHKLVEYDADGKNWYRFKDRGTLDEKTGHLTLMGLEKTESGLYEAEIQVAGKLQNFKYEVKVIDAVSKPAVTCNISSTDEAALFCSVDRGDQAVFEWSGPNELKVTGARLDIPKDISHDALFICTAKNDVSTNNVEFPFKECFKDDSTSGVIPAAIGGTISVVILSVVAGIIGFFWKKRGKYKKVPIEDGTGDQEPGNQNGVRMVERTDKKDPVSNQNVVENEQLPEDNEDNEEVASKTDTLHQRQDSPDEGQSEVQSVQNENEEKKDQQDNTINIADSPSVPLGNDEENPESTKENDENSSVVPTEETPADDEHDASSNMDDEDESVEKRGGAPGPQCNSEEKAMPESIGGNQSLSSGPAVLEQSRQDEDDSLSNMAKEAAVPPGNNEEKPESTGENDEDSSDVLTEKTPTEDEDDSSSNMGDEDRSVEKQSAEGDGQTVTTPPTEQPPTESNHPNAITPARGTVGKRIEKYENMAQKPKILSSRDADQEN